MLYFSVWLDTFGIRSDPTSHLDDRQQIKTERRKILFGCKYKKKSMKKVYGIRKIKYFYLSFLAVDF